MGYLNDHLQSCEFAQVPCTNEGCDIRMQRRRIVDHSKNECEHRLQMPCPHCAQEVSIVALQNHMTHCGRRPIECTHQCGVVVDQADLAKHLDEQCILRLVTCPLQAMGGKRLQLIILQYMFIDFSL